MPKAFFTVPVWVFSSNFKHLSKHLPKACHNKQITSEQTKWFNLRTLNFSRFHLKISILTLCFFLFLFPRSGSPSANTNFFLPSIIYSISSSWSLPHIEPPLPHFDPSVSSSHPELNQIYSLSTLIKMYFHFLMEEVLETDPRTLQISVCQGNVMCP